MTEVSILELLMNNNTRIAARLTEIQSVFLCISIISLINGLLIVVSPDPRHWGYHMHKYQVIKFLGNCLRIDSDWNLSIFDQCWFAGSYIQGSVNISLVEHDVNSHSLVAYKITNEAHFSLPRSRAHLLSLAEQGLSQSEKKFHV